MKENLLFLLIFLALNFIVFVPSWGIGVFSKIENSKDSFFKDSLFFILKKSFYIRHTDDFLKLVFEIQILSLVVLIFKPANTIFLKYLFLAVLIFSFIYVTYVAVITKIFKKMPNLINDVGFAKTGYVVFKKQLPFLFLGLVVMLAVVGYLGIVLIENLIDISTKIEMIWPLVLIIGLSALSGAISIKKINYNQYHNCVSFSFIKHLISNLLKSFELKRSLKHLNTSLPYAFADDINLETKPNVLFIFLESYGSFTLSNEVYQSEIKKGIEKLGETLLKNNFHAVSSLSESPVASGGSWLSHSSLLFGAKVKDTAAHDLIFGSTNYPDGLASIPKFFSKLGYKTKLASTVSHGKNEVNWSKLRNSYPFEDIMLIDDFNYTGKKVYFNGNRYTIPDEYTLNYSFDSIADNSPYFLCVSTTNSHYNFVTPTKAVNNWSDYLTEDFKLTDGHKKNSLQNYFTGMKYHFDYINTFFSNQNLENTNIVIIGDHQPPMVTPLHIDKNTPIHIISNNKEFLNAFKEFGFTDGLWPDKANNTRHESFFSKFLFALNKAYGKDKNTALPIFNDGINLY